MFAPLGGEVIFTEQLRYIDKIKRMIKNIYLYPDDKSKIFCMF